MRRNQATQAEAWPRGRQAKYGIVGFVVNPKLAKLALVVWDGDSDIQLRDLTSWEELGAGYFGHDDEASQITGLPRSHTPDGVKQKGMGYGTSLYTGLVMAAKAQNDGQLRISTGGYDGEGISSLEGNRSTEAERWWTGAKSKGLAKLLEDETEEERDISDEVSSRELNDCVSGLPGRITHVSRVQVELLITRSADVYTYDSATDHNLVALQMPFGIPAQLTKPVAPRLPALRGLGMSAAPRPSAVVGTHPVMEEAWQHVDPDQVEGSVATVLAADIRGISPAAMRLLQMACQAAGATEHELDELHFRWDLGLDPKVPIKQMRLPFKANGSEEALARKVLEKTAYLRSETGWSELADLPDF